VSLVKHTLHIVGKGGIKSIQAKAEAITNFPTPTSKSQLTGYGWFLSEVLQEFCSGCRASNKTASKETYFMWHNDQQQAFEKVKMLLTTTPVLAMPDFKKPFIIHVDASDLGVGAVLMQDDVHKLKHPICYFLKKFNAAQKNYSTSEKETTRLIPALQQFKFT